MEEIKTLANCTEEEFLMQTNKIRHSVERWMKAVNFAEIRGWTAEVAAYPEGADDAAKAKIDAKNETSKREMLNKKLNAVLDEAMENHPTETIEVIKLCCFVDPSGESRKITYYLAAFAEMLGDEDVLDFFSSLVSLAQRLGLNV